MQRLTDLKVWQRSHAFTLQMWRVTSSFPDHERFGLVSQRRRAVASVPTNIAERSKRLRNQDYARFLNIAEGSLAETRPHAPRPPHQGRAGGMRRVRFRLSTLDSRLSTEAPPGPCIKRPRPFEEPP